LGGGQWKRQDRQAIDIAATHGETGLCRLGIKAVSTAYSQSGVDIEAGNRAVELMREAVRATYKRNVLGGIGSFGGLFDAGVLKEMRAPVLVASTDGVGTKVKIAAVAGRYENIGRDLVNHCINDILVQGARPLFFLDYIASSKLVPDQVAAIVTSMAAACGEAGVALLGGETAEMPGVYLENEFDVAGTIVGVVERENVLPRMNEIGAGDMLIGLRSSGAHTNGYSLPNFLPYHSSESAPSPAPVPDPSPRPHRAPNAPSHPSLKSRRADTPHTPARSHVFREISRGARDAN